VRAFSSGRTSESSVDYNLTTLQPYDLTTLRPYNVTTLRTIHESSFAQRKPTQLPEIHVGLGQDEIDLFRLGVEKGDQVGVRVEHAGCERIKPTLRKGMRVRFGLQCRRRFVSFVAVIC
jgi:hypothetical protein